MPARTIAALCALMLFIGLALSPARPDAATERPAKKRSGKNGASEPRDIASLKRKNASLKQRLQSLMPRGVYVIVDTAHNVLYLKRGSAVIRKAVVSAGSGNVLNAPDGTRTWVFDTPRGEFLIHSKLTDPVWIKPDWAFYEEGETPPQKGGGDRAVSGVLGDFALGFGDGFFIHGTLYTRLLGYNVTHGCIRMGDDDLKSVYSAAAVGTRLYIY